MGKKGKGRSVKRNLNVHNEPEDVVTAPHSFVIHKGLTGGHALELSKDFRKVMEPFTASHLKERKKNTVKDFISVAGPLHVTHLSIFSFTEIGMYLKIMRLPRGPTLTFKVHNFSLTRDVVSSLKKQTVVEAAFKSSPLIVLNNFSGEGLHMKLMASMFQNMFPTLNLTTVDLNVIRRCVMMNYNATTGLIDFRHYYVKIAPVGISKGVKKVVQGSIPNLGRCNDISEFFTKTAIMSESEAEDDTSNHVTLPQKLSSRGNLESGKSAIRLTELGPRLTLQLMKIEDGLLDGEVLYHEHILKTEEEKQQIKKKREHKRKLKETRKKLQEHNKKTKEDAKEKLSQKSRDGMKKSVITENEWNVTPNNKETAVDGDDDKEYYRQEVGEQPDKDLFSSTRPGQKRRSGSFGAFTNKKRKFQTAEETIDKKGILKYSHGNNRNSFKKQKFENKTPFKKNKNTFQNKKGQRTHKTNIQNRDFRPIGGTNSKIGKNGKNKK